MEKLTLTGLLNKTAAEFPNRRALSVSGRLELSYGQLKELVDHAASLLVALGVKPADVVALTFPNTIEVLYPYPFFIMIDAVWKMRKFHRNCMLNLVYLQRDDKFIFMH